LESDLTHFIHSLETVLSVANAAVPDSISQMDLFHQFRNHCGILAPFIEIVLVMANNEEAFTFQDLVSKCRTLLQTRPRPVILELLRINTTPTSMSVPHPPAVTSISTVVNDHGNNSNNQRHLKQMILQMIWAGVEDVGVEAFIVVAE
jgi:hypothetical protein